MSSKKVDGGCDVEQKKGTCLAHDWFMQDHLAERGAAGRLIVAPGHLTRADLDFNWDVVALAMGAYGARVGVDQLKEEVAIFFDKTRMKGKKPVSGCWAQF